MDGVPSAYLDCPALDLLLDQETPSEACNISVKKVDRGQSIVHIKVVVDIAREYIIDLLF